MAIYSLSHTHIGRSTHKEFTAAAHINYITRTSAISEVIAEHIPQNRHKAVEWIKDQELSDRKNARIIDKIMIALPAELNHEQHMALVKDFCQQLTDQRCPWFAAIHSQKKDAHNPHVHIVIRDRDIETGKRVIQMSEKGSTQRVRELWEHTCNTHLALNGHKVRIDRRTLKAQGIDREPQIHIGPNANEAAKRNVKLISKNRVDEKGRVIRYPVIDKGRTRRDFNEHIIDLNLERLRRSKNYGIKLKAEFEAEQRGKDRKLIKDRDHIRSTFRKANGKLWNNYQQKHEQIKKTYEQERDHSYADLKSRFKPIWKRHYEHKENDFNALNGNGFSDQLARDLKHIWNQLDTTQDKSRGHLSGLFAKQANREEVKKALESHYNDEHKQIYKNYTDQKRAIQRLLKRKYDQKYQQAKTTWQNGKEKLNEDTKKLWQEFNIQQKERRREKNIERQNLESYIDEFNKNSDNKTILPSSPPTRLEERILKEKQKNKDTGLSRDFNSSSDGQTNTKKQIKKIQSQQTKKDRGNGFSR